MKTNLHSIYRIFLIVCVSQIAVLILYALSLKTFSRFIDSNVVDVIKYFDLSYRYLICFALYVACFYLSIIDAVRNSPRRILILIPFFALGALLVFLMIHAFYMRYDIPTSFNQQTYATSVYMYNPLATILPIAAVLFMYLTSKKENRDRTSEESGNPTTPQITQQQQYRVLKHISITAFKSAAWSFLIFLCLMLSADLITDAYMKYFFIGAISHDYREIASEGSSGIVYSGTSFLFLALCIAVFMLMASGYKREMIGAKT